MKRQRIVKAFADVRTLAAVIIAFSMFSVSQAAVEVPCMIFSGSSPQEHRIDLAKYNRLTFGDNSIKLSSSKDSQAQQVELLYSLFNHIEIKDAVPSSISEVEEVEMTNAALHFNQMNRTLSLEGESEVKFTIGVFDMGGRLMASAQMKGDEYISLSSLQPGFYIAVATDGTSKLTLKLIIE